MDPNNKDHVILLLTTELMRLMRQRLPSSYNERTTISISMDNMLDPSEWYVDVVRPFQDRSKMQFTIRAVIGAFGAPAGALRRYGDRQVDTVPWMCPVHGVTGTVYPCCPEARPDTGHPVYGAGTSVCRCGHSLGEHHAGRCSLFDYCSCEAFKKPPRAEYTEAAEQPATVEQLNELRRDAGMSTFSYKCVTHGTRIGVRCCGAAIKLL